jgi:beta-hydroxylase
MKYRWATAINRWLAKVVMTAGSSPNETGDQTGGVNKIFSFFWLMGNYRRKLKKFSKPLYLLIKFALIVGFFVWLIGIDNLTVVLAKRSI